MLRLLEQSEELVSQTSMDFQRYIMAEVDWQSRLIGIKGARGTGKTTLLLQWLKKQNKRSQQAAYLSLDDLYFSTNSLLETGRDFHKAGGEVLLLDEVHKYSGWAREIKNLHDSLPHLKIIFTGSSIIDISKQEADLSRRAIMYELYGLSFREYLEFKGVLKTVALNLETLTDPTSTLRNTFPKNFRPLAYFNDYLDHGYYPFFKESQSEYHRKLRQLIRTIVEYDMAELKGFDIRNAKKMLQLLYIISLNVPFKPNISALAEKSKIHRNSLNNYLHFLEDARLISLLHPAGISVAMLQKPEKIYMDNPNLLSALASEQANKGTLREVFFYNQVKVRHQVAQPRRGDFLLDGNKVFEIGGKNKGSSQIGDMQQAWIVKDGLEFPAGKALPLWLFGFLY